mgnify:CR=1 FL=1
MKKTITLLAATMSLAASANQSLRDDAILVEDIEYKLAAGFKADDVVYRLPKADRLENTGVRGGITTNYKGYAGVEARGRFSTFAYSSSGNGNIWRTGGDSFADIMLSMPNGNEFDFVRVWGSDTNVAEDLHFFTFERCLPAFGGGPIVQTILDDVESTGSGGDFSLLMTIPTDTFVDNQTCTYSTRVRFDTSDSSMRVFKVRAQSEVQL